MPRFCKLPLFQMTLRGVFSTQCYAPFLLRLFDSTVVVISGYGCQTNYLLFYL